MSIRRIRAVATLGVFVVRATTLIVMGATIVSPLSWFAPALNVLTIVAPIAFVLGPLLILCRVCRLRISGPEWAVLAAGWMVAAALFGSEIAPLTDSSPAAPTGAVKIVSMNVWDSNQEPARTRTFLRAQNADVLVLEEAREPFVRALQQEMPEYTTRVTCAHSPYCGVVILSRLPGGPMDGGEVIAWPPISRDRTAPVAYTAARLAKGAQTFTVLGVHLSRRGIFGSSEAERTALCERVLTVDQGRTVLAGDFNTWAPSFALLKFDACVPLQRRSRALWTWPTPAVGSFAVFPFLAIDHLYAGAHMSVVKISRAGERAGSDHYAIIAEIALPSADVSPVR